MKKNIIKFDATEVISYEEYNKIIQELQKWYQEKIKKVHALYQRLLQTKDYNQTFKIIKKHNDIVVELIKKTISYFNVQNMDIAIYLSNSFARQTNLIDSDIDLNFMYEDEKKGQIIEELISSILAKVMGKYRDFIHDSISHRIPKGEVRELEKEEVIYEIKFQDKVIKSVISSGNENLMYKLYNSNKDLNSFVKYYTGYLNNDSIAEWIYFQKEIYATPDYLDVLFSYIENTEKSLGIIYLDLQKKDLMDRLQKTLENLSVLEWKDMSNFKRFFKNEIYRLVYEALILLKKVKKCTKLTTVPDLLSLFEKDTIAVVNKYFGSIMLFNYICDLYGIEFRTRYQNQIPKEFSSFFKKKMGIEKDYFKYFKDLVLELLPFIQQEVSKINAPIIDYKNYNPLTEQINIENYSPLSYINNISKEYQHNPFLLPFIKQKNQVIPIHPDTLDDLKISRKKVYKYELVYPTSSFRTVYSPRANVFYKLPVLRQITRSIRDMKTKELKRSEIASQELAKCSCSHFYYLKEQCFYNEEEIYNYIIRKLPDNKIYPWFYCIASHNFSKDFQIKCIENMIEIWMFYASHGIYFESAHTQNFLVDEEANIYYRDLSDIRILTINIMTPSYIEEVENKEELLSVFFDRSMCSQNIEHFIRYCHDIKEEDIDHIKQEIVRKIKKYNLNFPNYSMNYDKNREGHHPIRTSIVRLRNLNAEQNHSVN